MALKIIGDHCAVIAIDIDGVLNDDDESVPMINRIYNDKMINLLSTLGENGYTVILYTSRDISRTRETKEWLSINGFFSGRHYYDIIFNKLKYDVIIDDRAFNPRCGIGNETIPKELEEIAHLMDVYLGGQ